jgi:hypothetical protein
MKREKLYLLFVVALFFSAVLIVVLSAPKELSSEIVFVDEVSISDVDLRLEDRARYDYGSNPHSWNNTSDTSSVVLSASFDIGSIDLGSSSSISGEYLFPQFFGCAEYFSSSGNRGYFEVEVSVGEGSLESSGKTRLVASDLSSDAVVISAVARPAYGEVWLEDLEAEEITEILLYKDKSSRDGLLGVYNVGFGGSPCYYNYDREPYKTITINW